MSTADLRSPAQYLHVSFLHSHPFLSLWTSPLNLPNFSLHRPFLHFSSSCPCSSSFLSIAKFFLHLPPVASVSPSPPSPSHFFHTSFVLSHIFQHTFFSPSSSLFIFSRFKNYCSLFFFSLFVSRRFFIFFLTKLFSCSHLLAQPYIIVSCSWVHSNPSSVANIATYYSLLLPRSFIASNLSLVPFWHLSLSSPFSSTLIALCTLDNYLPFFLS